MNQCQMIKKQLLMGANKQWEYAEQIEVPSPIFTGIILNTFNTEIYVEGGYKAPLYNYKDIWGTEIIGKITNQLGLSSEYLYQWYYDEFVSFRTSLQPTANVLYKLKSVFDINFVAVYNDGNIIGSVNISPIFTNIEIEIRAELLKEAKIAVNDNIVYHIKAIKSGSKSGYRNELTGQNTWFE